MITVLTGGTGGAKFIDGLRQVIRPEELTIIVNTGDDLLWWGLYVSPDVDSIMYMLAGRLSQERGWGVKGDTFFCLNAMGQMGQPIWFHAGDRDLATHIYRSKLLADGKTLSDATAEIAGRLLRQVRHVHGLQDPADALLDLRLGDTLHPQRERDVLVDRHVRPDRVGLEHQPDVTAIDADVRAGPRVEEDLVADPNRSGGWLLETGNAAHGAGLPAAGLAQQDEQFAGLDAQVEVVNGHEVAVLNGQIRKRYLARIRAPVVGGAAAKQARHGLASSHRH